MLTFYSCEFYWKIVEIFSIVPPMRTILTYSDPFWFNLSSKKEEKMKMIWFLEKNILFLFNDVYFRSIAVDQILIIIRTTFMDELYPRPKNGLAPHALNFGTEQRERECVCLCVCERERERKSVWVCDRRVWE